MRLRKREEARDRNRRLSLIFDLVEDRAAAKIQSLFRMIHAQYKLSSLYQDVGIPYRNAYCRG